MLPARGPPCVPQSVQARMPHDVRQVPVVGQPEIYKVLPIASAVVLRVHPFVLLIRGQYKAILDLQAHEALMIVGG